MLGHISLSYTFDGISKWLEIFKLRNARTLYYLKACFHKSNKGKINRSTHYTSYYCLCGMLIFLVYALVKIFQDLHFHQKKKKKTVCQDTAVYHVFLNCVPKTCLCQ